MATITGTGNPDDLVGQSENDAISGLGGADYLVGGAGDDTLDGGAGDDVLAGQEGADALLGGAGDDTIEGDADDAGDTIDGGDGVDMFDFYGMEDLTVDLTQGLSSSGASLVNIENVWGNIGDDSMRGGDEANEFLGSDGDDTLEGGGGADSLHGGEGFDTASYEHASAGVTASLIAPQASSGDAAGDTYTSIEGLRGSSFGDGLAGDNSDNRLEGGGGDDTLEGGGGDDLLDGGAGFDVAAFSGNLAEYTVTLHRDASGAATHVTVADGVAGRDGTDTVLLDPAAGATVERFGFADGEVGVICFMPGTLIATPIGEVAVEKLRRGDLVLTAGGRAAPVQWMGRQTVSRRFADPLRVLPIRIAAGALGEGLPRRDLLVSPDHALFLDGLLVHAGALVNGATIRRETNVPERWTYWHVELADHALVLAEGVAAETFVDNAERLAFDNWAEHQALHPDGEPIAEMPLPRAKSHRQVPPSLRRRLAMRARGASAAAA